MVTHFWPKLVKKSLKYMFFCDFQLQNLLIYPWHCYKGQQMMSSYPKLSPMVLFILMAPYGYLLGYDTLIYDRKWTNTVENVFLAIFASITSYSTHNIVYWVNEWCPVILWYQLFYSLHSLPHICTLEVMITTICGSKSPKNMFLATFTSITSYSTHDIVYGPKNGAWIS
jgi:hypothetical protein